MLEGLASWVAKLDLCKITLAIVATEKGGGREGTGKKRTTEGLFGV